MTLDVKWIKLAVGWYKSDDVRLIRTLPEGDSIALMFVMLLAIAGDRNQGGNIPYSEEELSVLIDMPLNIVRLGLAVMHGKGMIDQEEGVIHISNWDKYQSVDAMERIRERDRERKREKRALEKEKAITAASVPALPAGETKQDLFRERFDRFWKVYPKKVGKGAAEKSFLKLKPSEDLMKTMIQAVEAAKQTRQWQRDGGQYIPNPATWLNQRRWEDELPEEDGRRKEQEYLKSRGLEDWDNE